MAGLVEVKLVSELRNPQKIADITGGTLVKRSRAPWTIEFRDGVILWAGYPKERDDVCEAVPFLKARKPWEYGVTLCVDAAILTPTRLLVVSPGFPNEDTISGYVFEKGGFSELKIPIAADPWGAILQEVRDLARQEFTRYYSNSHLQVV